MNMIEDMICAGDADMLPWKYVRQVLEGKGRRLLFSFGYGEDKHAAFNPDVDMGALVFDCNNVGALQVFEVEQGEVFRSYMIRRDFLEGLAAAVKH